MSIPIITDFPYYYYKKKNISKCGNKNDELNFKNLIELKSLCKLKFNKLKILIYEFVKFIKTLSYNSA